MKKNKLTYTAPEVDVCKLVRARLCQTSDAEFENPDNPMPWGE